LVRARFPDPSSPRPIRSNQDSQDTHLAALVGNALEKVLWEHDDVGLVSGSILDTALYIDEVLLNGRERGGGVRLFELCGTLVGGHWPSLGEGDTDLCHCCKESRESDGVKGQKDGSGRYLGGAS
jgi:hypothetical protein